MATHLFLSWYFVNYKIKSAINLALNFDSYRCYDAMNTCVYGNCFIISIAWYIGPFLFRPRYTKSFWLLITISNHKINNTFSYINVMFIVWKKKKETAPFVLMPPWYPHCLFPLFLRGAIVPRLRMITWIFFAISEKNTLFLYSYLLHIALFVKILSTFNFWTCIIWTRPICNPMLSFLHSGHFVIFGKISRVICVLFSLKEDRF